MASAEDYAAWIVANKDKQGTPEFDTVANAYKLARSTPTEAPKGGDSSLSRDAAIAGGAMWKGATGLLDSAEALGNPMAIVRRNMRGELGPFESAPDNLLKIVNSVFGGGLNGETIKPQTNDEKMLDAVVSSGVSALGGGPGGGTKSLLASRSVKDAAGAIADGLKPAIMPAISGVTAGATGEAVQQAGGGTLAQIFASLLGGMSPYAAKGLAGGVANKAMDIGATVGAKMGSERAIKRLATDYAERVSGADRDFIKAAERAADTYVPGANPTTAEAIAQRNAMTPDVRAGATVKLQKDLTGALGAEDILPTVAKRQRQALEAPLNSMAGGSTLDAQNVAQDAAKAARQAGSGAQYEAIAATPVNVDSSLTAILNSPAGANALAYAKTIAKNDEAAKVAAGKTPIPFEITNAQGNVTGYTAQGLQYVKSAIDEMASNKTLQDQLGIVGTGKGKVGEVGKQLVSWMNKNIPGWETARNTYASESETLNRLQVAQALVQKLKNEKGDLTSGNFLNVRGRGEEALIKNATGVPREVRFDQAGETALEGITKHLARNEEVNRIAGSVKGAGTSGIGASEVPQIPHMLNSTATVTNFILKKMGSGANEPVAREIAQRMANGTYGELLARPAGDPKRAIVEALLRSSAGTMGAQ